MGSIPFSLLIAKFAGGIDLRKHGSGNVGATNVARTMGKRWGFVALLLDALKGALPVAFVPMLVAVPEEIQIHQAVLCGIFAVVGHMFPPWLKFKGGKGVATSLGVVTILAPLAMLVAATVFLLSFLMKRIVSLSSILAAAAFPIAQFFAQADGLWNAQTWSLGLFCILVPALIILRHRSNIVRLYRGEEQPLSFKKTEPEPTE
ncbi:UNVERIFIED_CONTAM: hypothetical protein GTU68_063807 [Idotea baltica]|nr:hypothetical protein [Idotea baltica]